MFFCPLGCQNKIKTEACCWTTDPRLMKPGTVWAVKFSRACGTVSSLWTSTCGLGCKQAISEILKYLHCMTITVMITNCCPSYPSFSEEMTLNDCLLYLVNLSETSRCKSMSCLIKINVILDSISPEAEILLKVMWENYTRFFFFFV